MLNVSAQWQSASRDQFRYQAYLRATLLVSPPGLRQGSTVSSDQSYPNSNPRVIMDVGTSNPTLFGSLDVNRLVLDGSVTLLSKSAFTNDWWSNLTVDSELPVIHFEFDKVYSTPGLYVQWDVTTGSYPTSVTIKGYDTDGNVIYTFDITGINSVSGMFKDVVMDDIKSVDLIINEWVNPGWRARINELMFGIIVDFDSINNGRISGATQIDKSDPLSAKLPTHSLSVTFRNLDKYFDPTLQTGISKYLAQQQIMKCQWGFVTSPGVVEWTDDLIYLIENFTVPEDSKDVQMDLTNRLTLLTTDFYKGTYTGSLRTLYDIAQYVLENSNMVLESDYQQPWIIPESLKNFTTMAPIPSGATNTILQYIAMASCTWLKINSTDGFIQFTEPQSKANDYCALDLMQELGDPKITIIDRLRSVTIGIYHYSVQPTSEEVGKCEYFLLTGTNVIKIKYSKAFAANVSAVVSGTGATLQNAQYYASYAVLTIQMDSEADVTITLTGKEIVQSISYMETYRDSSVSEGIDVVVENPLITQNDQIQSITDYVVKYYSKRNRYKIPYTGYPQLEATDRVHLNTVYGSDDVDVVNNTIEFNGAWSGTVEVI